MKEKKRTLPRRREEVALNEAGIDAIARLLTDALERAAVHRKDVLRLRLAVEDIWDVEIRRHRRDCLYLSVRYPVGENVHRNHCAGQSNGSRRDVRQNWMNHCCIPICWPRRAFPRSTPTRMASTA